MKRVNFILLLVGIMLSAVMTVYAVDKETVTVGYGASYQSALDDALRSGVEQAVGVLVDSQTLVRNYQTVSDEIYLQAQGFVKDYSVLKEEKNNGQFRLTVRVVVDTEPNSALLTKLQRMGLINKRLENPRIAVIIPEYHLTHFAPDPAGETAIILKLRQAGFKRIIDPSQLSNIRNKNAVQAILVGDKKMLASLCGKYGVDFIIIGEAFSEYAGNILNSGVHSCRARVEAKIIKADTGQVIAANGFQSSGVDIAEVIAGKNALTKAGEMMGDYLVSELLNYAGDSQREIVIVVKGLSSYEKLNAVVNELKQIRGLKNIYIRDYSSGIASLDVDYSGLLKGLANEIINLKSFLKIESTGSDTINLRI